jgi:hypothetical protein
MFIFSGVLWFAIASKGLPFSCLLSGHLIVLLFNRVLVRYYLIACSSVIIIVRWCGLPAKYYLSLLACCHEIL